MDKKIVNSVSLKIPKKELLDLMIKSDSDVADAVDSIRPLDANHLMVWVTPGPRGHIYIRLLGDSK